MSMHATFSPRLAHRSKPWLLAVVVVAIAVAVGMGLAGRWPANPSKVTPAAATPAASMGAPIKPQPITSRATDRYVYGAELLNQLAAHDHPTCRAEVAGANGLREMLAQAEASHRTGAAEAASTLAAFETRLDLKFKMGCLTLG